MIGWGTLVDDWLRDTGWWLVEGHWLMIGWGTLVDDWLRDTGWWLVEGYWLMNGWGTLVDDWLRDTGWWLVEGHWLMIGWGTLVDDWLRDRGDGESGGEQWEFHIGVVRNFGFRFQCSGFISHWLRALGLLGHCSAPPRSNPREQLQHFLQGNVGGSRLVFA
jgi:hypothetical protein